MNCRRLFDVDFILNGNEHKTDGNKIQRNQKNEFETCLYLLLILVQSLYNP